MGKERGEKEEVNADVERIRPILEKDPEWPLASGQINWDEETYYRESYAVSRLTKKAVCELFPEYKVHVHRGRGSASNWINVNFVIPDMEKSDWRGIIRRTRDLLLSVGIQYGSFLSDFGPGNDCSPCLDVSVNHTS